MAVLAHIAFGANLGDRKENHDQALSRLSEHKQIEIVREAPLYKTEPLTLNTSEEQPWYLNTVWEIKTTLSLHKLLQVTQQIERSLGRLRRKKWSARTADLDILFYGPVVYQDDTIKIPHAGIPHRLFVLEPLHDLIPDFVHPELNMTIAELRACAKDDLRVMKLKASIANPSPSIKGQAECC